MYVLKFKVDGHYVTRIDTEKPVTKCRHLYRAQFEFVGEEWTGTKTALFVQGKCSKAQMLDEQNSCEIPWEFFDSDVAVVGLVSVFCGDLATSSLNFVKADNCEVENATYQPRASTGGCPFSMKRSDRYV